MISEVLTSVVSFFTNLTSSWGYLGILTLMAVESSLIPFPSEIVLPPAGILISQGKLSFFYVFLASLAGSLIGAFFNYYLAFFLGRKLTEKLIAKYGKFLLLSPESLKKSEEFFHKRGSITTFVGRLLPAIRQLISLPAGFAKMNLLKFAFYTALGSSIWSIILILIGIYYGNNQEKILAIINKVGYLILIFLIIGIFAYFLLRKKKKNALPGN